jgi:hypothetical protein
MTEQSNIIKIYDKEYDQTAFDANQKLIVSHIKVLQQKVANLRFELDQASVAQDAFINKLLASLDENLLLRKKKLAKVTVQSVKAELDTLSALSQERFIELLNRTKRLETVLIGTAGTTIVLLISIILKTQ